MIAFSGGVDSTLLLKVAKDVLNDNVAAFIGKCGTHPEFETKEAVEFAEGIKTKYYLYDTSELLKEKVFKFHPHDLCYYCKHLMFSKAQKFANDYGYRYILEGTNTSDLEGHRPGYKAIKELDIKSPFIEANIDKQDIRQISRSLGLKTHDKASFACTATRIAKGIPITEDLISKIEKIETYLYNENFKQFRARYNGESIRIELYPSEFKRIVNDIIRLRLIDLCNSLGFDAVYLDLVGYVDK